MNQLKIVGGTVVDGTGAAPRVADVMVADGRIVAVGPDLEGDAETVIDATGKLVTPGFVDCHTHYDGQVTWDPVLEPSSLHGVTTVVMGNCGVGFAPVRPGKQEWLIQLMEGVEDIPGSALSEGMTWGWESFGEYLDVLDDLELAVDVAAQISHGAVRGYVMEERGAANEAATPDDIAAMKAIVAEALAAGAVGFSTSRTLAHTAIDGEPVPGTFAAEDELFSIGAALGEAGHGVFELAPMGSAGEDIVAPAKEVEWMCRLSAEIGRPVTFALVQVDAAPELWRELMNESMTANQAGAQVYPQISGRPAGVLIGLQTNHAFTARPSFAQYADLPLAEKVAELRKPEVKAQILSEKGEFSNPFAEYMGTQLDRIYVLGNPPNYEPGPEMTVAAIAEAEGEELQSKLYDLLLEDDGTALLMFPFLNYSDGDAEAQREMLLHPAGVVGLSDGGAHCGSICDASMPTWMLTNWVRDRSRGETLPLEYVVKKQSHDTARLFGFTDRGTVEEGMKADLNVIDFDALTLHPAELIADLPAGGRRLVQRASGYDATIVNGEITRREGADTGARPGSLVRGSATA
jgi:N-acyl-D-aspartate/D-glutamate deacylase